MARTVETIVTLTDDLDGGKADRTVSFTYEGAAYEIDLSKKNAAAFDKLVAPYTSAGRRVPRTTRGSGRKRSGAVTGTTQSGAGRRTDLAEIREWAKANGHKVSGRGRIAQNVQDAYDAAH